MTSSSTTLLSKLMGPSTPEFTLLCDYLSQPALPLLRHLLHKAATSERFARIVYVSLDRTPVQAAAVCAAVESLRYVYLHEGLYARVCMRFVYDLLSRIECLCSCNALLLFNPCERPGPCW
jgi:hypothetical protein